MNYAIVGLGAAGAHAALAILERDASARLHIFSDESYPFYFRSSLPLYLGGTMTRDQLWGLPQEVFAPPRVTLCSRRVTRLSVETSEVLTQDGQAYPYERLLVCPGAAPVRPVVPGSELAGVLTLWSLADADQFRKWSADGGRAVILGGGMSGLALAWAAVRLGMKCTLIAPDGHLGMPCLDARASQMVYRRLAEDGIEVLFGDDLALIDGSDRVSAVGTVSGREIPCRWVGVGLGAVPRDELPREAGLMPEGELRVDAAMRTALPNVYAAGDVCKVWEEGDAACGRSIGWHAASSQGRVAGTNMTGGAARYHPDHYYRAGMFYDVPVILIGRFDARGDAELTSAPQAEGYRRLVFRDGRLIGAVLVSDLRHARVLKRIIETGVEVRGHELQLLRTDVDLNPLLGAGAEYHFY